LPGGQHIPHIFVKHAYDTFGKIPCDSEIKLLAFRQTFFYAFPFQDFMNQIRIGRFQLARAQLYFGIQFRIELADIIHGRLDDLFLPLALRDVQHKGYVENFRPVKKIAQADFGSKLGTILFTGYQFTA
jgi:hypothetical protein